MSRCDNRGVLAAASGILLMGLLAGCSSYPNPPAARAGWEPPLLKTANPQAPAAAIPDVDEARVRAYAHFSQGVIYDLQLQPELAQQELSKAAQEDPSNTELVLDLTRRFQQAKQPEKALGILLKATALPDASGTLFAQLALVYARLGRDAEAVLAAQTGIKRTPGSIEAYRALFFIDMQQGRTADALKVLEQAAKIPRPSVEFGIELAALYANLERQAPSQKVVIDAEVRATLNRVLSQNPASLPQRLKLADTYYAIGDVTNATTIYLQLLESYTDLPAIRTELRDKLADIYLRDHDYVKAKEQLKAIVLDDPANSKAYYLLGTLADEDKKFAEAADYFQKTLLLDDNNKQAYYNLAQAQIDANQPKAALLTLDKARGLFSAEFTLEVLSALAYERRKDYTNEVKHFTAAEVIATATDPKRLDGAFYFDQGAASERAGDIEQAEKCFEKSLSLTPNFAEALNYLGYMWAERGVKLDQAYDMIKKAVSLEPKSPAYLDSLGWVLYKLNRPQDALPNLQKAIELSPEPDPTLYDHLGDIFLALKQTGQAHDAWNKSLSLEPNALISKKLHGVQAPAKPN